MNCLKNKFTFKFLEIITINEFFIILNVLKKHFFNINNRLNNIRHDEIKKNNKNKTWFIKKFFRKNFFRSTITLASTNTLVNTFNRLEKRRFIFKNKIQIFRNVKQKHENHLNCFICEKNEHFVDNYFHKHNDKIWLQKKIKKKLNFIENTHMQNYLINVKNSKNIVNIINNDSKFIIESKN